MSVQKEGKVTAICDICGATAGATFPPDVCNGGAYVASAAYGRPKLWKKMRFVREWQLGTVKQNEKASFDYAQEVLVCNECAAAVLAQEAMILSALAGSRSHIKIEIDWKDMK